jgi:hypothetical protein
MPQDNQSFSPHPQLDAGQQMIASHAADLQPLRYLQQGEFNRKSVTGPELRKQAGLQPVSGN